MTLIFTSKTFDTGNNIFVSILFSQSKQTFYWWWDILVNHWRKIIWFDQMKGLEAVTKDKQTSRYLVSAPANLDSLEADIEKQPRHRHSNLLTWSFGDSQGRVTWIEMETNKLVNHFNLTILSPGHGWAQPEKLLGHHSNLEKESIKIESTFKVEGSQFTFLELMLLYLKFLLTFNINWPGERDSWSNHWLLPDPVRGKARNILTVCIQQRYLVLVLIVNLHIDHSVHYY